MQKLSYIPNVVRWLLALTTFVPVIVFNATIYPFVFPKIVFYRSLVEIALAFSLLYFLLQPKGINSKLFYNFYETLKRAAKNPIAVFLTLFLISLFLSAFLAENSYRAFWGDIERGVGVFGFLHFFTFLILSLVFFTEKDWSRFLKLSFIAGALLILFVFLEYFGWRLLFLKPQPKIRPESFIGNAAFLATHLIFLAIFAFIIFRKSANHFWKYFSIVILFLSLISIFLTATRGAILGLGVGFFILLLYFVVFKPQDQPSFLKLRKLNLRLISLIFLGLLLLLSVIFWQTREAPVWQKIPGVDRLARTAILDINDPSTQFRIITWRLSWEAFKERPIFGWGPENYIVAYEKYYDPEYALYGETWLDRAHNTVFDLLVMQGLFGTVAYFGLFISLIYFIIKKIKKEDFYLSALLVTGLVAYFVQNIVIFDQIISYAMFFALMGYVLSYEKMKASNESVPGYSTLKTPHETVLKAASVAVIALLLYSVIAYNFIPYAQAVAFKKSPGVSNNAFEVKEAIERATSPYNFAQYFIRNNGIDTIYLGGYFDNEKYVTNPKYRPLGQTLIEIIGDLVKREPYDVRVHTRLVEMLNSFSLGLSEEEIADTKLFEIAENLMRDAVRRAPTRQEMYYHLAFNLAAQKKFNEAVEVAQYAIDLEPKVARAHYHLALVSALAGRNNEAQKALMRAEELAPNFERFLATDLNNIAIFYKTWGWAEKYADLVYRTLLKINDNKIGHIFKKEDYEEALRYYIFKKNAERAITIAEYLGRRFPELKEDMEKINILIERGEWPDQSQQSSILIEDVQVAYSREYYESELRRHILAKNKEEALKAGGYLLESYPAYSTEMGIDVIVDLIGKEKWEILQKL